MFEVERRRAAGGRGKQFRPRHTAADDAVVWTLPPAGRGLVSPLPAVKRAIKNQDLVVVVAGEKDADRLTSLALAGAARVVVIPDADAAGLAHAASVARSVAGTATRVQVVDIAAFGHVQGRGDDVSNSPRFSPPPPVPARTAGASKSHTTAQRRGRLDAVIASLLFMGGLRRSEVSALEWRDVSDARDGDGVLLTVRTSKTNQEGDAADVRYLKNGAAKAIRTVRADRPDAAPTDRVVGLSPLQIQRRFTAAARAGGIEARVTAHSGRVGLASELTARGASTTEVMLAGNWKTARMVAHYSAGATAERGAVRKYL